MKWLGLNKLKTTLMDDLTSLASTLQFPRLAGILGRVAGVLLEPLPGSGERFCVAVVAEASNHIFDASVAVNPNGYARLEIPFLEWGSRWIPFDCR